MCVYHLCPPPPAQEGVRPGVAREGVRGTNLERWLCEETGSAFLLPGFNKHTHCLNITIYTQVFIKQFSYMLSTKTHLVKIMSWN